MQQQEQGEERCETQENSNPESQENSHAESQENTSDEIVPDATSFQEEGENDDKEFTMETPSATTSDIDVENGINNSASSDSPSTRSKTSRGSKKRLCKLDKGENEAVENAVISEDKQDNGLSEVNIAATDEPTPNIEEPKNGEDEEHDVIVDEQEETIIFETSVESSYTEYSTEFPAEDGNEEGSQNIVSEEEEISESASDVCEGIGRIGEIGEIEELEQKLLEDSQKQPTLTLATPELIRELHYFPECDPEEYINPATLSVPLSSLGCVIRSVSARKPVRKSSNFAMHGRSSVSTERVGTDGNYSDTDCSVDTTEGSAFSSLKRKACNDDTINSKKQKIQDSKNSKFFSMVSSPLRMLKNKLSDRIVESLNATSTDNLANGNNENEEDDVTTDKMKVEGNEIKEKSLCVVSNEVSNQNSMYQSWCCIM